VGPIISRSRLTHRVLEHSVPCYLACALACTSCSQAVLRAWSDRFAYSSTHTPVNRLQRLARLPLRVHRTQVLSIHQKHHASSMACTKWTSKPNTQVPGLQCTGLCLQRLNKVMNNHHPVVGDDALGMELHALRITRALQPAAKIAVFTMQSTEWTQSSCGRKQQERHVTKHSVLHAPHPMQAPSTDSMRAWMCGYFRCRTAMMVPSSVQAVTSSSPGQLSFSMTRL